MTPGPGPFRQLHPHRGVAVELPGPLGPWAAYRAPARPRRADERWDAVAVLVPGYSGSKEDFAPLVDAVADAGIAVLAVDLPGQPGTPARPGELDHHPAALGALLADVVRAEAAAGHRVLLLGHSYGGFVARAAVLAGAPVTGLTLLGSGPGGLPMGPRRTRLDVLEPILRRRDMAAVDAVSEAAGERDALDPAVADFLRARTAASSPTALLGEGDALRSEPDRVPELAARLRGRRISVLVVCGADDDAWPVALQRTMADRLEAEFAAVAGAGHAPNVENPEGLLDVLVPTWRTWLEETTLQP